MAVSAAFHSRFVAEARTPFLETLRAVPFANASIPVYANTTASPYPEDPEAARNLLAGQLAEPVEFVAEVEAMHRAGSPDVPRGRARRQADRPGPLDPGRPRAQRAGGGRHARSRAVMLYDLALALAQIAALGHAVTLSRWDDGVDITPQDSSRKPSLTVKV